MWLLDNCNELPLFKTLSVNVVDGREPLVISDWSWENAVVSTIGGGVKVGNGCIEGRPSVSRLVTII